MGGRIWGENGAMGQGQNDQCAPLPPPCPVIAAISVCNPINRAVRFARLKLKWRVPKTEMVGKVDCSPVTAMLAYDSDFTHSRT